MWRCGCSGRGTFPGTARCVNFAAGIWRSSGGLFVEVVRVAREMGVVRLGTLSIDGTKVRANASKRKAMSYERMLKEEARLKEEIEALLSRAGAVDAEEDERYGEEVGGDELPEERQRREKWLAAIEEAKERLEAAQRAADDARGRKPGQDRNPKGGPPYKRAYGEPDPKAQSNFTDPESRIIKTSTEGFQQCYNAQMAVDGEHPLIVATDVGAQAADQGQMIPLLDEVQHRFGAEPEVVLADAGYCNEADLVELEERGIDGHVALGREGKTQAAVRDIRRVGVLGAGTMGGGISMAFANAGLTVSIVEQSRDALDRGLATVRRNYERSASRGRFSGDEVEERMGLLRGGTDQDALAECDLVIEAVFEDMELMKSVFAQIDRIAKPGALLATNTSYLDVIVIGAETGRPEDVVGMHFFSPANIMKLVEVVRGEKSAPDAIATAMSISRTIGKVPVLVGVCHGFVGNRMLFQRRLQADRLRADRGGRHRAGNEPVDLRPSPRRASGRSCRVPAPTTPGIRSCGSSASAC